MSASDKTLIRYLWAPRTEVAFLQSVVDAYEGLARIRTERHEGDESLLMFMVSESRSQELAALLDGLQSELATGSFREFISSPTR